MIVKTAYNNELATDNNGVKYLLGCEELFDGTVDTKGMETKEQKAMVGACSTILSRNNRFKKVWVGKGTESAEHSKLFCKAEGMQNYLIFNKVRVAFAERRIRSLKSLLHRYMEDYGYRKIQKLPQFVTTLNSRKIARYT